MKPPDDDGLSGLLQTASTDGIPEETVSEAIAYHALPHKWERELCGVPIRPFMVFADWLLLRKMGNEVLLGHKVGEMAEPTLSALEIVFIMHHTVPEMLAMTPLTEEQFTERVTEFAGTLSMFDPGELMNDVILLVNEAIATRVDTRVPKMPGTSGGSKIEGNG